MYIKMGIFILFFSSQAVSAMECNYSVPLASIMTCHEKQVKENDAKLNIAFRELRSAIEKSAYKNKAKEIYWDLFVKSQKNWIKMRDEQCTAKSAFFEEGSFSQNIELNKCLSITTKDRYFYLKEEIAFIKDLP